MIEYWFMLPVGIIISTIAMMSGIGGAILFSPFFIIILKLEPVTAIATGLAIEMFGFTSGVIGYLRKKLINFTIVKQLIWYSVPATFIGVFIAQFIPPVILEVILATVLLLVAHKLMSKSETNIEVKKTIDETTKSSIAFGGLLVGLVSSGLGELSEYIFLTRLKLATAKASATSVFIVAMSAIIGVMAHSLFILEKGISDINQIIGIIIFAVPGVIIGAQIGVSIAQRIKRKQLQTFLGILFSILGIMMYIHI